MKSAAFEYHRATTLDEAFACMARYDGQAQWLAGGQSLLAMMNLRLANPPALITSVPLPACQTSSKWVQWFDSGHCAPTTRS